MKKVEVTEIVQTKADRIIRAFIDPAMLRDWCKVERTLIDARPGGLYIVGWNIGENGFGYLSTGIIQEYDPSGALVIDNYTYFNPQKQFLGPMTLTVKAIPKGRGAAEMYICQDGYRSGSDWDWYYEAVKGAWPMVAKQIRKYLES